MEVLFFMASQGLLDAIDNYEEYIKVNGVDDTVVNAYVMAVQTAFNQEKDIEYGKKIAQRCKEHINNFIKAKTGADFFALERYGNENGQKYDIVDKYYSILLCEAPYIFESFLLYLEKKREYKERFYSPKRKQLNKHGLIQSMQDLEDDKLDRLCISMPPGTQKTTLEKFFCSWIAGKYPQDYSLFFSHSGDITRKFYDGILDIITNSEEYTWGEIFPDVKLQSTNAKLEEINLDRYKPYSNIQCSSVGAKNSGKVRTNRYLYCDDLIGGIEEALNPALLDKIWRIYGVDLKQRKLNEQVKEIIIMTRWSTRDPIGRLKVLYGNNNRNRFLAVPDIDPQTGESNFDYEFNGMSVEFFNDQAMTMDDVSYRCLYKNEPIEREGLLFTDDSLRRYMSLPSTPPDAIYAQCDHKDTGTDYMFMPVLLKYGEDYYLTDCVCNQDPDYEHHYDSLTNMIVENKVQAAQFESNQGGGRVATEVSKRVEQAGHICNITSEPTETNKEARIFQCASWVKKHILFKDQGDYAPKSEYGEMMSQLLSYSVSGKNIHDDIPDCLALFALRMGASNRNATIEVVKNPFWN